MCLFQTWTSRIECFKIARVQSIVLVSLVFSKIFQRHFYSYILSAEDHERFA